MKSTDTLLFYAFGQPAFVSIDSINPDYVQFTLAGREETMPYADFLHQWGAAPYDNEGRTIAMVIHPLHFILSNLRQLHYGEHCNVEIVARWQERNAAHYRVHDSFGGCHTYRFEQDGKVSRSEHESFEFVARFWSGLQSAARDTGMRDIYAGDDDQLYFS